MFSHSDVLGGDKGTLSDEIIRKMDDVKEEVGEKEEVVEKEEEEEQAGGEGMEWHSDGSKGEFTMLMSFEGDAWSDSVSYPILHHTASAWP
jgi:hypothetical protein